MHCGYQLVWSQISCASNIIGRRTERAFAESRDASRQTDFPRPHVPARRAESGIIADRHHVRPHADREWPELEKKLPQATEVWLH
jgi:hypothetical protein